MTVLLFLCSSMDSSQSLKFCKDFRLVFKLSREYSSPNQTEGLLIACCVDFDFLWWMFSGMSVLAGFTLPDRAQGWPGGPGAEPKGSASCPGTSSSTSHGHLPAGKALLGNIGARGLSRLEAKAHQGSEQRGCFC